jgi:hypothetical protein
MHHTLNAKFGDTIEIKASSKHVLTVVIADDRPKPEDHTLPALQAKFNWHIAEACNSCGISIYEFFGQNRKASLVAARFYVYKQLRLQGLKYTDIAKLCQREHGTIMHGVATFDQRVAQQDPLTMDILNKVKNYEANKY